MFAPQPEDQADGRRVVSLVLSSDNPRAQFCEFLDNLTEEQERAVLDFLADHLPLLRACREIEAEQVA